MMTIRALRKWRSFLGRTVAAIALPFGLTSTANAETPVGFNLYGSPGLIDMPTAEMPADGMLSTTIGQIGGTTRTTLSFQIAPRLSGSFRYSGIRDFVHPDSVDGVFYDRSFDVRYQLIKEGTYLPSVVVGLQDFMGTGLYGGEYIVATKELAPGLKATAGLGWGRLGSSNPFATLGTRPTALLGTGGQPNYDRWFRGDVAAFGGISYAPNERLRFKVEYSSDDYALETTRAGFKRESDFNFGVDYTFKSGTQLSLYHAYGTEVGAQLTFNLNPKTFGVPGGIESAPQPVKRRGVQDVADLGWTNDTVRQATAKTTLSTLMDREGLTLEALRLEPNRAVVRMINRRYNSNPQAIGRTARAMTRALPGSVETFEIIPMVNGLPGAAIIVQRSDLENLENADSNQMLAAAEFVDAAGRTPAPDAGLYPKLDWSIAPFIRTSYFDPDSPLRADVGLRAKADWKITPNLVFSGSVSQRLAGNLDDISRRSSSGLPRVRTDSAEYLAQGDTTIDHLTLSHYGRPGKNLYSRVTVGYLERMYAGASAEILWKPVTSRLAFGAELNYVRRRAFDQGFGLQTNTTVDPVTGIAREIPVLNGHVSAYYDFGHGYHGQIDVGRYLAGDYGATISLDRQFANGLSVGAFATFTDASAAEFGEGSFDKGIRVTIPIASLLGTPNKQKSSLTLRSLTRDGGARLNVQGRLYDGIRPIHQPEAAKTWGRFWR